MATETAVMVGKNKWMVHDVVVGLLTGAGVGSIAGLLIAVRVTDNNVITLIGAVVGAAVGVAVLVRSHQNAGRFLNVTVVVTWVLLVLSAGFIALLIDAIANFE